ncbi:MULTISPECIES: hypothetical protein [unclassified Methylophaga]|jgi:hypothetical protein|uniref:hypothetical protein n=3 Tax=Methylophaga TaxID=40222 RepID=UPI0025F49711|nr:MULTISPECIES: hypothetical protein [unclassified Methylophaga]|tara:strand:+ start:245 stop:838 length:594 start_codon:yes stop_codon:yes gene_type:complete
MKATSIRMWWLILFMPIMLMLNGCSGRIIPPQPPESPRAVFVLDHGHHSSLIIEDKQGDMTRYSYGDWRYYAEGNTGIWSGLRALFVPTQAGLGRKQLSGPASIENIHNQITVVIANAVSIEAEAKAVDDLQLKLEKIYRQNQGQQIYHGTFDLYFVPYPKPYSFWHNSNHMLGQWLSELGTDIHGWPLFSNWQLQP